MKKKTGKPVPKRKVYVLFDDKGNQFAKFRTTSPRGARPKIDCVQIPCPQTFDAEVTCWK
jgi:hypothetical protein